VADVIGGNMLESGSMLERNSRALVACRQAKVAGSRKLVASSIGFARNLSVTQTTPTFSFLLSPFSSFSSLHSALFTFHFPLSTLFLLSPFSSLNLSPFSSPKNQAITNYFPNGIGATPCLN